MINTARDLRGPRQSWNRVLHGILLAVGALGGKPAHSQGVLYVHANAAGFADGSSWVDAFTDLQDALDVAQAGDEIWVAEGVYKPDRGTGDRNLTFEMVCGAAIYGGFAGHESCRDERDWEAHRTIFSGDLSGDDGPRNCEQTSNCCEEHESYGCDDALCQAIVCTSNPECCDSKINNNGWWDPCAALARVVCCHLGDWHTCDNARHVASVIDCDTPTLLDGITVLGGYYLWVRDWTPDEFVELYGFSGSGVRSINSEITVRNCRFEGSYGSDVRDDSNSGRQELSNINIVSSKFDHEGPGIGVRTGNADVTILDCDFLTKARLLIGAGALPDGRIHFMHGCRLVGTNASISGDATITNCLFQDGNGLQLLDGISTVADSVFTGNLKHLNVVFASAFVDNCLFVGSTSQTVTGGAGGLLLRNCALLNNSPFAAAIGWGQGFVSLLNTTIVGNGLRRNSCRAGGIELQTNSSAQVLNSIIWGNGNQSCGNTPEENQIFLQGTSASLEIDYSIVEGWSGLYGGPGNTGNFCLDPMFADLDGPDDIPGTLDDNARLLPGSPAINAGFGSSQFQLPTDLDGHSRVLCGAVDIGAYEFGLGDFNCDQNINMFDFSAWPGCMTGPVGGNPAAEALLPGCEAFDANADGDVDLSDFPSVGGALAR